VEESRHVLKDKPAMAVAALWPPRSKR